MCFYDPKKPILAMVSCTIRSKLTYLFSFLLLFITVFPSFAQDQAPVQDAGVIPGTAAGATAAASAAGGIPDDPAIIEAGQTLFKNNCTMCHAVTADVVVGPGLQNVHQRRPLPWLIRFIRNSQQVIQSGDAYAVELYNKYNKTQMPSFQLSDDEITSMIAYLKSESEGGAVTGPVGADAAPGATTGAGPVDPGMSRYLNIVLIVLVLVLIAMVITLVIIASILRAYLKQNRALSAEDAEELDRKYDWSWIYKSRAIQVIVGLIFVMVILTVSVDWVMDVGIQQGYAPRQPIAFSHALHAGEHAIDCNYCHTSVYKSASANIPSANICMNCHSQIATQSSEVQKIYRAIERKQPIEWVRVHNLPDLAYFNHSQHTQVGGVACQTCHGPIQEMEVVAQWSPLTMGWCVNCHRETELNTQGNGYYDKLVQIHNASTRNKAMTVASNGGTECSKCHY
jgi:mono/diheme cytochrome c family protein